MQAKPAPPALLPGLSGLPGPTWLQQQSAKALLFQHLHRGPQMLVIGNAWDAASARMFEDAGVVAIGTSSAGVAFSHGHRDDTAVPRSVLLAATGEIAAAVRVPVTADILNGLGATPRAVAATVKKVVALGAVGVNIEDGNDDGTLADIGLQAEKIAAAVEAAQQAGVDIVINARTDACWLRLGDAASCLRTSIERARRYRQAGAHCLFVPGVVDAGSISTLVGAVDGPLNILAGAGCPSVAVLQALGVRRLSLGSGPMRAAMLLTRRIARDLLDHGSTLLCQEQALPYAEANALFIARRTAGPAAAALPPRQSRRRVRPG